jgi:hypothetical protein
VFFAQRGDFNKWALLTGVFVNSPKIKERDSENNIERLFLSPSIMNKSMAFVRPVISLDAVHLKSKWKGTLYMASVKTACDEVYPVAFAIVNDNENIDGDGFWSFYDPHYRFIHCPEYIISFSLSFQIGRRD